MKATLIKRTTDDGVEEIEDYVPLGQVYDVKPESILEMEWIARDDSPHKGKSGKRQFILASSNSMDEGWFPLEMLKLEEN